QVMNENTKLRRLAVFILLLLLCAGSSFAKKTKLASIQRETLSDYVQRMQQQNTDLPHRTNGSLWTDSGKLAAMNMDYKAMHVGDLVTIGVAQGTTASNAAAVSTARNFNASSGITGLAGQLKTTGVENLFSPQSSATLTGKSQGSTSSTLNTTLAGRVVFVL